MNFYQKTKNFIFGQVKNRYLIGRRLVLNFSNSVDGRVSIVNIPDWNMTSFCVKKSKNTQAIQLDSNKPSEEINAVENKVDENLNKNQNDEIWQLVMQGVDKEFVLSEFYDEEDAFDALSHVRRKFTKPYKKIIISIVVIFMLAIISEWLMVNAKRASSGNSATSGVLGGPKINIPSSISGLPNYNGVNPTLPNAIASVPTASNNLPATNANGEAPKNLTNEQMAEIIKRRYNVDIKQVPGGNELLEQATVQANSVAQGGKPGAVPTEAQTNYDTSATINLLEKSK